MGPGTPTVGELLSRAISPPERVLTTNGCREEILGGDGLARVTSGGTIPEATRWQSEVTLELESSGSTSQIVPAYSAQQPDLFSDAREKYPRRVTLLQISAIFYDCVTQRTRIRLCLLSKGFP